MRGSCCTVTLLRLAPWTGANVGRCCVWRFQHCISILRRNLELWNKETGRPLKTAGTERRKVLAEFRAAVDEKFSGDGPAASTYRDSLLRFVKRGSILDLALLNHETNALETYKNDMRDLLAQLDNHMGDAYLMKVGVGCWLVV